MKDKLKDIGGKTKDALSGAYRTIASKIPGKKEKGLAPGDAESLTKKALKATQKVDSKQKSVSYSAEQLHQHWLDNVEPNIRLAAAAGDRSVLAECPEDMQGQLIRYGRRNNWRCSKWENVAIRIQWGNRFSAMTKAQRLTLFVFMVINLMILAHVLISNGVI